MHQGHRHLLDLSFKVLDLSVMVGSYVLATGLLNPSIWPRLGRAFELRMTLLNLLLLVALMIAWQAIFVAVGLYRSRRLSSAAAEIRDIIKATSLGTMAFLGVDWLIDIKPVTLPWLLVFWVLTTSTTAVYRLTVRIVLKRFRVR